MNLGTRINTEQRRSNQSTPLSESVSLSVSVFAFDIGDKQPTSDSDCDTDSDLRSLFLLGRPQAALRPQIYCPQPNVMTHCLLYISTYNRSILYDAMASCMCCRFFHVLN